MRNVRREQTASAKTAAVGLAVIVLSAVTAIVVGYAIMTFVKLLVG